MRLQLYLLLGYGWVLDSPVEKLPGQPAHLLDRQGDCADRHLQVFGLLNPVASHQRHLFGDPDSLIPEPPVRADGNNVDIDVELTQMAETGIRYQALSQLITRKYQGLRTILQGR